MLDSCPVRHVFRPAPAHAGTVWLMPRPLAAAFHQESFQVSTVTCIFGLHASTCTSLPVNFPGVCN
eukprot:1516143-Rhodomonas_salina.2